MYLKELTNEEFSNFTNVYIQDSVYQTKEYAFTMNKQGFDSLFLGLVDDSGTIIAATLLLVQKKHGFRYAYAPRGFLLDYTNYPLFEAFTIAIKKYLSKKDVIAIKLCPIFIKNVYNSKNVLVGVNRKFDTIFESFKKLGYYHLGYNNFFESLKPRFENTIDISKPTTEIYKSFDRGTKNKIRKAIRCGISIHKGDEKDLQYTYLQLKDKYSRKLNYFDMLYDCFSKIGAVEFYYSKLDTDKYMKIIKEKYDSYENRISSVSDFLISAPDFAGKEFHVKQKMDLDKEFDNYRTKIVRATELLKNYPEGAILSTGLVIKQKETVYLFISSHDKTLKEFSGNHLLIWSLIDKYTKEGYKNLNLGGLTNITLDDNKYKGLNDFKRGFGGNTYEFVGDYELVTNSTLYFMYKNSAPFRTIFKKKN
jgi:Uncharacterized protein involved in methicillin resistance